MLEINRHANRTQKRPGRERGIAAVEFAIGAIIFLVLVFGVIEIARLMFLYNTLQEVTRKAASSAANTDFTNVAKMDQVRQRAIFQNGAGSLPLMPELTDQAVRIDFISIKRNDDGTLTMVPIPTGSLPASPADNRKVCLVDPNSASCIRLVRARICDPGDTTDCQAMQFQPVFSLVQLAIPLTTATTLAKAQSLGLVPAG
jgi:hypothetical protein